jgi:small-conductance mechanosensitive channel
MSYKFIGNDIGSYLKALVVVVSGFLVLWVVKVIVLRRLSRWAKATATRYDDLIVLCLEKYVFPLFYFGVFSIGFKTLTLNPSIEKGFSSLTHILITFVGISLVSSVIKFVLTEILSKSKDKSLSTEGRLDALMPAITVIIWVVGILFLLDNLGFKISAIMAGLGIGGVAVALAASAVFADLFAYFVILFDQPFVLGDFIIVGDFQGTVERIGIKTTRIRSIGGELAVFPNKDLTDSRLRNFKVMNQRRIVFKLGVTYDTSLAKLESLPDMIKKIIENTPTTRFDRAHFSAFGDFSLVIEVAYFVLSSDYNVYMDLQQKINFQIKKEFESRGIEFAFPTQTLILQKPVAPNA